MTVPEVQSKIVIIFHDKVLDFAQDMMINDDWNAWYLCFWGLEFLGSVV